MTSFFSGLHVNVLSNTPFNTNTAIQAPSAPEHRCTRWFCGSEWGQDSSLWLCGHCVSPSHLTAPTRARIAVRAVGIMSPDASASAGGSQAPAPHHADTRCSRAGEGDSPGALRSGRLTNLRGHRVRPSRFRGHFSGTSRDQQAPTSAPAPAPFARSNTDKKQRKGSCGRASAATDFASQLLGRGWRRKGAVRRGLYYRRSAAEPRSVYTRDPPPPQAGAAPPRPAPPAAAMIGRRPRGGGA